MNITEAWEEVVAASEAMVLDCDRQGLIKEPPVITKLRRALGKVKPRVQRMRARLECVRARKAGRPTCPKGLEP